jgi:hypothetical protein
LNLKWITEDEQQVYDRIVYGGEDIRLMRASLDGDEIAVIVDYADTTSKDGEERHKISAEPLAILISEAIFNRISPPSDPVEAMKKDTPRGN